MHDLDRIAQEFGFSIASIEKPVSGQHRTVLIETTEGQRLVIKWSDDSSWAEHIPYSVEYSRRLIERGYPAPATIASRWVDNVGHVWLLERLDGHPMNASIDDLLFSELLDLIELQADSGRPTPDWSWVHACVFDDEAGWWKSARVSSAEAAELCDELWSWVNAVPRANLRNDFVVLDLNFSNILVADHTISGIVDLDHLSIDARCVDIAHLAFELEKLRFVNGFTPVADATTIAKDRVLQIGGEPAWRLAVAYRATSSLGWRGVDGMRTPEDQALFAIRALADF